MTSRWPTSLKSIGVPMPDARWDEQKSEGDPWWLVVLAVLWYLAAAAFCFGMVFWAVKQVSG